MNTVYHHVGGYQILRKLGRGGMADVFLAVDTASGQHVALKLLEIGSDRDAQDALEAERRGALLQERLCAIDPHVATVYSSGETEGLFFIAMEYVEGDDLSTLLRQGPLPPEQAVGVAIEICDMLAAAHGLVLNLEGEEFQGVIHGDIKPKNVRITPDGRVKVLDFGIAKALTLSRKLTRNEFGSVAYSSPERLDSGEVDVHSDLWSVGVVLYETVAGAQPFREVVTRRLEEAIRGRRAAAPLPATCPLALQRIVLKALAPDLEQRYQLAADLNADLVAFQQGRVTNAELEAASQSPPGEATRRTRPASPAGKSNNDEKTRRTVPAAPAQPPALPTSAPGPQGSIANATPATAAARPSRFARVRAFARKAVLAGLILVCLNEVMVLSAANDLRDSLPFKQRPEMDEVWTQYQQLADRSFGGIGVGSLRAPLKERLLYFADRIIANYRSERPTIRERDWQDAHLSLTRAFALDQDDTGVKARLRYCEGQLQRISGEARAGRRPDEAQALLNDAVVAFQDASRLNPRWPDPWLGLARTYIYGLDDIEKGAEALERAERAGFKLGNRETAQLADGYRRRGERLWKASTTVRDMPQEREYLEQAVEADRKALALYGRILSFAEASRNIRTTQRHLEHIEERIAEIDMPPLLPPTAGMPW